MQFKHLALGVLVGAASAQIGSLNSTLAGNNNTSELAAFLGAFPSLIETLNGASNITLLAPSNDALSALLSSPAGNAYRNDSGLVQALLQYHVLNGSYPASSITNTSTFVPTALTDELYTNVTSGQVVQGVKIANETIFYSGLLQNATVVQANLNFTGGIIHVIDTVLTVPPNVTVTASAANLTAFNGALNATELTETIDTMPDLTIFAPDNDAFQAVGSALANLSTDDLASILTYHVVNASSVCYSSTLENGTSLTTLGGKNLTITMSNGTVFVNSAKVVVSDLLVANGVVHIIDNLLNPSSSTATPTPSATEGAPAFPSASSASDIPFTSGQPTPTSSLNPSSAGPGPASSAAASSTTSGAAMPARTGAVGAAALFGGAAAVLNF